MKREGSSIPSTPDETGDVPDQREAFQELRRQLLGPEIVRLERLEERLEDSGARAAEISRVLPEAITLGVVRDDKIARALQPAIDQSLKVSVTKNPQALAEAIFPALGPGIRKAIRATITGMIQSLNAILNQSFSLRGLKWRFEALRTRTSFAEVVLLHTLVYQVEQIFLIHRSTGIVLQHVEAEGVGSRDPDLVSGMLTAIQDFMNDSFQSGGEDELETLRMGKDRSVWVEQGPRSSIAAVIRGRPPLDLRRRYRDMIDAIHLRYRKYLDEFNGDVTPFAVTKDLLEDGLKFKVVEEPSKPISPIFAIALILAITAASIWGFSAYRRYSRFTGYVQKLKAEPGVLVMQSGREDGRYLISGLKDPLARDVKVLAQAAGLTAADIDYRWEPYYALHPALISARAKAWLAPPESVRLSIRNGVAAASGRAPHEWIMEFRERVLRVPGIHDYDTAGLQDADLDEMQSAARALSAISVYFDRGKADIREDNIERLVAAADKILALQSLAGRLNRSLRILISGYADASGAEQLNQRISLERAQRVMQYLVSHGINPAILSASGKGTRETSATQDTAESAADRVVSFKVLNQRNIP